MDHAIAGFANGFNEDGPEGAYGARNPLLEERTRTWLK